MEDGSGFKDQLQALLEDAESFVPGSQERNNSLEQIRTLLVDRSSRMKGGDRMSGASDGGMILSTSGGQSLTRSNNSRTGTSFLHGVVSPDERQGVLELYDPNDSSMSTIHEPASVWGGSSHGYVRKPRALALNFRMSKSASCACPLCAQTACLLDVALAAYDPASPAISGHILLFFYFILLLPTHLGVPVYDCQNLRRTGRRGLRYHVSNGRHPRTTSGACITGVCACGNGSAGCSCCCCSGSGTYNRRANPGAASVARRCCARVSMCACAHQ